MDLTEFAVAVPVSMEYLVEEGLQEQVTCEGRPYVVGSKTKEEDVVDQVGHDALEAY